MSLESSSGATNSLCRHYFIYLLLPYLFIYLFTYLFILGYLSFYYLPLFTNYK